MIDKKVITVSREAMTKGHAHIPLIINLHMMTNDLRVCRDPMLFGWLFLHGELVWMWRIWWRIKIKSFLSPFYKIVWPILLEDDLIIL
jgi:hypothetical protein